MPHNRQTQRVLDLASRKGMLRPADLDHIEVPRVILSRMVGAGLLERIDRGIYRLSNDPRSEHESLAAIATRVPQAVFCLLTALQFHGLTTQLPREVWIAMPRGSHAPRIDFPPIKMIQVADDVFSAGIDVVEHGGIPLRVYSAARTVADCFKHRNKVGLDVALEALRDARAQQKASADDLWRYAKICRVANVMRPYLEAVE